MDMTSGMTDAQKDNISKESFKNAIENTDDDSEALIESGRARAGMK